MEIQGNMTHSEYWYPIIYWGIQYNDINKLSEKIYENIYTKLIKNKNYPKYIKINIDENLPPFQVTAETRIYNNKLFPIINFILNNYPIYYCNNILKNNQLPEITPEMKKDVNTLLNFLQGKPSNIGWNCGLYENNMKTDNYF